MKTRFFLFILCIVFSGISLNAQRGTIIQATPKLLLSAEEINAILVQAIGEEISPDIVSFIYQPNYQVAAYQILYNTIDANGEDTYASGAIFVPVGLQTESPMAVYCHGTMTSDYEAPSSFLGMEAINGLALAMSGYITVLPDYLGLGAGPGVHPYVHAKSEASATIDMMIAAKSFCSLNALPLTGDVLLSGYSQGAHAVVATQKELEKNYSDEFSILINVAGSGPYSLSLIQKNFMFSNPTYSNPGYLPYLILGYEDVYGNMYNNLSDVFVSPYDQMIPELYNGLAPIDTINNFMPLEWRNMYQTSFLEGAENQYFHPLNVNFRKNDLLNWKPKSKLRLLYTTADEQVAKENSIVAGLIYKFKGAEDVVFYPVGNYPHFEGGMIITFLTKLYFDCESGVNQCITDALLSGLKSTTSEEATVLSELIAEEDIENIQGTLSKAEYQAYVEPLTNINSENDISLYPIPAGDFVTLSFNSIVMEKANISITDITGKVVKSLDNINTYSDLSIDISSLPTGVYYLKLQGERYFVTTMVKE